MKRKNIFTILILFFAVLFIVGAYRIHQQLQEYSKGTSSYTDMEQYVSLPEDPEDSEGEQQSGTQSEETVSDISWPEVDFAELSEINPDIVAWIYIEDTEINYPVVQGSDNQYYLKHLFSREWNSLGCIFLDSRNKSDFSDRHSIIYGHHMKNGTMFSGLTKYKEQEFYDAHPTILLMTAEQNFRIKVFAGYVTTVNDDAWKIDFDSDEKFEQWFQRTKELSCIKSKITPAVTDRIITLSTCSYEFDNARFVLIGIIE